MVGGQDRHQDLRLEEEGAIQREREIRQARSAFSRQAPAALAILLPVDGDGWTESDAGEAEAALEFLDGPFDRHLNGVELQLGGLGDRTQGGHVTGGHGRKQQVFRRPEAAFATELPAGRRN